MAVRTISSLLKRVRTFVLYSTLLHLGKIQDCVLVHIYLRQLLVVTFIEHYTLSIPELL